MEDYPKQKLDKEWITSGITSDIITWTESFGKYLCAFGENKPPKKALTTGQLRKFFGEVKRIDANVIRHKSDIPMLKPLLAYAVGRDKNKNNVNKSRIDDFEKELRTAIEAIRINNGDDILKSDFKNFVQLFESIVAYHKYYGGQENNN